MNSGKLWCLYFTYNNESILCKNYIFSFPSPKITADEIFISTAYPSPKIYPAFAFTSYFVKEKNEAFLVLFKDISII